MNFKIVKFYKFNIMIYLSSIMIVILSSCVDKSKYEKLQNDIDSLIKENNELRIQNEELQNGETRLFNYIKLYNDNREYLKAYDKITDLKKYHPETSLLLQHKELFAEIERKALSEIDSIKKFKEDSLRLANINDLGVWEVRNYVNDFGEPSGNKYVISNFYGNFSNSATPNDELRVNVCFTGDKKHLYVMLKYDEYNNGTYEDEKCEYTKVVNKEKRKIYVREGLSSSFYDEETGKNYKLKDILMEEGVYSIYMRLEYKTEYEFSVDTRYLNNALIKAGLKDFS